MRSKKTSVRFFYTVCVSLTLSVLLLVSCGALPAATPTQDVPGPGSGSGLATPGVIPLNTSEPPVVPTDLPVQTIPSDTPETVVTDPPTQEVLPTETLPVADAADPARAIGGGTVEETAVSGGSLTLAPGTSAGLVRGSVGAGQVVTYTLQAAQSQPLTLILKSPNNDAVLGVTGPTGVVLLNTASKYARWQMTLPATGTYTIQVVGGAADGTFALTYKLPLRTSFAAGTTSTTVNGKTTYGYLFSYAFTCAGGQSMSASLNVPATTAIIDIYGIITGTLLDTSANLASWTGVLPANQDYIIEVVPVGGAEVDYALTVACTGTPGSYSSGEITFAQWTTAAVRQGSISPGQVITYTVNVSYAQPLIVDVESPNWDVTVGILDPNGAYLFLPAMKWTHYIAQAQYTGMYTIKLYGGATTEAYTLTTKVGRLMNFPNDNETSVTYYGETTYGYVQTYAFRCGSGNIVSVSLDVDNTKAYLAVFGVQSGVLLDFHDMETEWSGTLAQTEEIIVEVIPRGGYLVSYNLTVTIP